MAAARTTPPPQRKGPDRRPQRRMSMPYDPAEQPAIVQPPADLAHLSGDELFEALTDAEKFKAVTGREPEKWYSRRFWTEVGRSEGRFKVWMVNHYKVTKRSVDPATIDDKIMVKPDGYDQRSPWWLETTARAWAIQEKLMRRNGVRVPYKPPGRPKGSVDSVPRQRRAPMRAGALEALEACEELTATGATLAEAKAQLAERYNMTSKQIARRLTTGREMRAAGVRPLTPDMSAERRALVIGTMYRLLMADGRRKHTENARREVAERLGCDIAEVDRVTGTAPVPAAKAPTAAVEEPRNYAAEDLRAEMEAAIVVDDITRGAAPLHPRT